MDDTVERSVLRRSASRLTILAHLFGILSTILMLIWLLHYRQGIEYDSDNPARVFNVHPFLMFCGFIFLAGEAMMGYKTVFASHYVQKIVHGGLHFVAMVLGVVGICAVFRFHDMAGLEDMVSLHSWIGLSAFILFGVQWLFGLSTYLFPQASMSTKARMLPWHVCGGRAVLYMSVCSALTGLMQRETTIGQNHYAESRLINFTALSILLFGIFVDFSVALGRFA